MTKLIVHIGYPKTATSSLQKNVLIPLHESLRLNYLGEETKPVMGELHHDSKFVKNILLGGPDELNSNYCVPSDELDHYRANRIDPALKLVNNKGVLQSFLKDDVVNILSYETLLMPYRSVADWKSFPQRLYNALPTGKRDVQIVVTLRNQASLMESFFFEKSLGYYLRSTFATPRQFYFEDRTELSLRDCEQVDIFDFLTTLTEYEKVFGRDNIHILFYEDISNNPDDFFNVWAGLMGIPASKVSDMFNGKPKSRITPANKNHLKLKVSVFDYLLKRGFGSNRSAPTVAGNKSQPRWIHRIIRALKKLPLASRWMVHVKIPRFTTAEKNAIFEHFKASNMRAAEIYDLDPAKMKKYGYYQNARGA